MHQTDAKINRHDEMSQNVRKRAAVDGRVTQLLCASVRLLTASRCCSLMEGQSGGERGYGEVPTLVCKLHVITQKRG